MLPQDLENSAGSWDMYGTEDERRYPGLQAEFFQRAAAPLRRREAILGFVGIGEAADACTVPIAAWCCMLPALDDFGFIFSISLFCRLGHRYLVVGCQWLKMGTAPNSERPKEGCSHWTPWPGLKPLYHPAAQF